MPKTNIVNNPVALDPDHELAPPTPAVVNPPKKKLAKTSHPYYLLAAILMLVLIVALKALHLSGWTILFFILPLWLGIYLIIFITKYVR